MDARATRTRNAGSALQCIVRETENTSPRVHGAQRVSLKRASLFANVMANRQQNKVLRTAFFFLLLLSVSVATAAAADEPNPEATPAPEAAAAEAAAAAGTS